MESWHAGYHAHFFLEKSTFLRRQRFFFVPTSANNNAFFIDAYAK